MRNVCVIGGSRYFGRHLIELFLEAGIAVTVVNRGSVPAPPGATRLVADRDDEAALRAALGPRTFDAVVDQVCYTPAQAAVACRVFADRTPRYVMTSTMEVYDPATGAPAGKAPGVPPGVPSGAPCTEDRVDPAAVPVDLALPWRDLREPARRWGEATAYAEGKRQAEAVFTRDAPFAFATVRSAHVLGGGALDFTGRLAHYVERIAAGRPVGVHRAPRATSFVHHREIAAFLFWAATSGVTGPLNACSHGELTVTELCGLVAGAVGTRRPRYRIAGQGGGTASPFSFDRYYALDNGRASAAGFGFSRVTDWLPGAVAEALTSTEGV
ncbi:NAD-dependent epimerase/dehydratase family protein [Streptomyces sp. NPDC049577]|uniref:NAD-dependent epimerase/dehydratase family protein n=1 Tax=Streptomyces sp. NPDC049577 TaxID=3155153 RepID=UPI00342277BE